MKTIKPIIRWIEDLLTDEYYSDCPITSVEVINENTISIIVDENDQDIEYRLTLSSGRKITK